MKIFEIKNHYFLVVTIGGLLLFLSACCSNTETAQKEIDKSQSETNNGYVDNIRPEDEEDIVFNEMMANQLATVILHSIYGKNQIERQRPFNIELKNNEVWIIRGSKPVHTFGGLFYIEIRKKDAKVLGYFHTR